MQNLRDVVSRFAFEETGATMIEYGVMLALIVAVCFVIITTVGTSVQGLFTTVTTAWAGA